jgi:hypothetical protein
MKTVSLEIHDEKPRAVILFLISVKDVLALFMASLSAGKGTPLAIE